ncbi:MAG: hypothetical protein KJO40_03945 [Deltaproteobacteria bacterium]|nr:hypothetical protein [Deltaproteobacteria bacterium]NND30084.1 hypothetical protein [Myxococcales bacterium]MBT8465862.1 hypothetical protein [Deltaproteobacteria bacterium]MBT8481792.1 hypothetical protein [Deltaproteobacteria bacterium]NNK07919.1 hypothetical protein [Myxococcales bacterium]
MTRFAFGYSAPPMLAVVAAGLLGGCGDVDTFKLRPDSWGEIEPRADWQGALIELVHVTEPCNETADGLRALVGDHMEFANCAIGAPKSRCAPSAEAALAIDVQPRSIIYDFSNVEGPGVFGRADFDGYVIANLLGVGPRIVAANIDRDATTLDLDDDDIVVDGDSVHANFEGHAFNASDFVKIDLVFESLAER